MPTLGCPRINWPWKYDRYLRPYREVTGNASKRRINGFFDAATRCARGETRSDCKDRLASSNQCQDPFSQWKTASRIRSFSICEGHGLVAHFTPAQPKSLLKPVRRNRAGQPVVNLQSAVKITSPRSAGTTARNYPKGGVGGESLMRQSVRNPPNLMQVSRFPRGRSLNIHSGSAVSRFCSRGVRLPPNALIRI